MKRKLIAVSAVLVAVAWSSICLGQPNAGPGRGGSNEGLAARRRSAEQQQQAQRIREQIAELRESHGALLNELRAIHATAVKEKATDTADRIEKLIGKRQGTFQAKMAQLERRQQRIQMALGERTARPERTARRGRRAPDFELDSFDGRTVSLSQYKGRVVVLEWFNMECPFSKYHYETKPTMVNLARKYRDKEVVWLTINSTAHTSPEANVEFAQKYKLPFPILDDRSGRVGRAYGARTTPHMFIIDKEGYVAYNGAVDSAPMGKVPEGGGTIGYVDQALAALTSGQKVNTSVTPPYGCSVKYGRR